MASKSYLGIRELVTLAIIAALMVIGQVAIAVIPNVEVVSLLVILTTLRFRAKALFPIYVFVLLEGLIWGFGIWWVSYLYVWTVLWALTLIFKNNDSPIIFALVSALFGLFFGALTAIPYLFAGGIGAAVSYFVAGVSFDLVHCIANFVVTLILLKPLWAVFKRI